MSSSKSSKISKTQRSVSNTLILPTDPADSSSVLIPSPDLSGSFVDTDGKPHHLAKLRDVDVNTAVKAFTAFVELYPGLEDLGTLKAICEATTSVSSLLHSHAASEDRKVQVIASKTEGTLKLYHPPSLKQELIYTYPIEINI